MTASIERFVPAGLVLLGGIQALTGLTMLADPGWFHDRIASFPPENEHFVRDIGTFTLSLGLALLWSVRSPSWRLPLLAFAALQFALHSVNHLIDIEATEKAAHGPANFAAIAIGTAFLALLLYGETARRRRAARRGGPAGGDP